jgi:hypothetical protein
MSITPGLGATVKTPDGLGTVVDVNLITGNLFVKPKDSESIPYKIHRDKVKLISKPRRNPKNTDDEEE